MATLETTYAELRRFIGRFVGYGRDPSSYSSTDRTTDVDDAIRQGLRDFYFNEAGHRWSFLRLVQTIDLIATTRTYSLPENFCNVNVDFIPAINAKEKPITLVDEDHLRSLYASDDKSGFPFYASVRPEKFVSGGRTVYEVSFYPVPTVAATLTYRHEIEPDVLAADNARPHGGAAHSQTIMASCMAAADEIVNPESMGAEGGLHHARFRKLLASSIALDGGQLGGQSS